MSVENGPVTINMDGQPGTLVKSDDGRCVILPARTVNALNGIQSVKAIITGAPLGEVPAPIAQIQMPKVTGSLQPA